jgi:signal transduction histidine kinase
VHLGSAIEVAIHDDGRGFDLGGPRAEASLGLAGMRERASLAGGQLEIDSGDGDGTTVRARFPFGAGS